MSEPFEDINTGLALRGIAITDLALVAEIHSRCFPDDPWSDAAMGQILCLRGAFGFLATKDGAPAGFLLARSAAEECELLTLGVLPETRRQGVGKALLEALIERVGAEDPTIIHLEVSEPNKAAQRLYAAQGFQRVGRRPDYYASKNSGKTAALLYSRRV